MSLLLFLACAPTGQTDWGAQREASGPCYRANLLDGLDEDSTAELHDVFACVNQQDNFAALIPVDEAMDALARSGDPLGVELARGVNRLPEHHLDVWRFAEIGLAFIEDDQLEPVVQMTVELLYATPYERVDDLELKSGAALDKGVLRPLLPGLQHAAGATLDADLEPVELLADVLEAPETEALVSTLAHVEECEPELVDGLPAELGDAIERSRDASNDRWPDASGDAMRDLAESLLVVTGNDGRIALEHLADPARVILEDDKARDRVLRALQTLENEDRLESLPPELLYLTRVDAQGGSLQTGEDSALVSLLRLVHDANGEMTCSLDLWVTSLSVTLPNLSVALLELIAQTDPSLVDGGVDLLGTLIGWQLPKSVAREIARSGVCDVFTEQVLDDLDAVDRFNDPQAGDLLVSLHEVLAALYRPNNSRVPELVDVLATTHAFGASRPFEELLRDIGTAPLVYSVLDLLPALRDPQDACGDMDGEAMDLKGLWAIAAAAFRVENGRSNIERLAPPLQAMMAQEGTWSAIGNLGGLLQDNSAVTPTLMTRIPGLLALDPEFDLLAQLSPMLRDPASVGPLLRVAENPAFIEAAGRAELTNEGALPFYARIVVEGTLDALLNLLDWTLDLLRGD